MFKNLVLKLPVTRYLSFKNIESSPFFRRTTKKPVLCYLCKKELKNLKINIGSMEEYCDVDEIDKEEFSNKWNLPRNSP